MNQNILKAPLSYSEAALVLKAMSNNRSPGSGGFSVALFKMFWKNEHF